MIKTNLKTELFNFSVANFFDGWALWKIVAFWVIVVAIIALALTIFILIFRAIERSGEKKRIKEQEQSAFFLEPNESIEPTKTLEPAKTLEPTKVLEPAKAPEPVKTQSAQTTQEAACDNALVCDTVEVDYKGNQLNSMIEQIELEESISTLTSELQKSKQDAIAAEEKLLAIKNMKAADDEAEKAKLLEEKIAKRKVQIALIRSELKNVYNEQSCIELKDKFYKIHLELDDDERTSAELTDLIIRCMSDANHAAVLARYKRMLNRVEQEGYDARNSQATPRPRVRPNPNANNRSGRSAPPRPAAPRSGYRPTDRSARPTGFAPRNSDSRPIRPNPRDNNF